MSRKDFILIADAIRTMTPEDGCIGENGRKRIAEHFAVVLSNTNSQFKRELFIQAATGVVPVNARKARV